jgi:hypothetical protein
MEDEDGEEGIEEIYNHICKNVTFEKAMDAVDVQNVFDESTEKFVYGEINFSSFATVLQIIVPYLQRGGVFMDLGHGTGKACVAAALLYDFESVNGVEMLESLYMLSLRLKKSWMNFATKIASKKCAIEMNFIRGDLTKINWSHSTVLFINSTCFDAKLMEEIAMLSHNLAIGSFLISHRLPICSTQWEIFETLIDQPQTCGLMATVYIQRKIK